MKPDVRLFEKTFLMKQCWPNYFVLHFLLQAARDDNYVKKVTQQWHNRDQTKRLNATVDSCLAVFAARQHDSVTTSSSD